MKKTKVGPAAVAALLLVMATGLVAGQESGSTQSPPLTENDLSTDMSPPSSLEVAEIPREADGASSRIRSLILASRPDGDTQRVMGQLSELGDELSGLDSQIRSGTRERVGLRQLARMENDWQRVKVRLERWRQILDAKAATQQSSLESLHGIGDLWRNTREELIDDEAADAVMDRVDRILDQVGEAEREIGAQLSEVLELENLLLGHLERVREALARLTEARDQAGAALIRPEQPPLWRLFSASRDRRSGGFFSDALVDVKGELDDFLRDNTSRIAVHVLLAATLFVLMLRLRRESRMLAEKDAAFEQASRVLGGPVAATLVVSLLLTRWIYFQPSRSILEAALLLALVPLMLLVPKMIPRVWHRPLYALGALLVIGRIESLVVEQTLAERFLQLLLIGLGLAAVYWLLRGAGPLAGRQAGWMSLILQVTARAAAGALVVALIANVVGSVALADLLTAGIFLSAYVAVVFLAAYIVLDALIVVGLEWARARSVRSVDVNTKTIRDWSRWWLQIGFVIWWAHATLYLFHLREPVLGTLGTFLGRTWAVGNLSLSIGMVVTFLLSLWISVILSRIVHAVLEKDVLARVRLPRGVPATIATMARYGVVAIGVLVAASAVGIELSQFAIVAGALGVGIGFGLQNLINNFVSGLILVFERPIHIGDTVETGTVQGEVKRIGMRSSIVRTFEGAEVIVPNGNLISSEVTNWTLSDRLRRVTIAVGIEYGTAPRRVEELLLRAAAMHEKVASHPKPHVLFTGFGASSLDFELRFWTSHQDDWLSIRSEVTMNVNDGLAAAGIGIPFPQRDLHLRTIDATWPASAADDDEKTKGD